MSTDHTSPKSERERLSLIEYVNAIYKRKWMVAAIFMCVVFFVIVFTIRQPKVYEAVATIEIDLQADRVFSDVNEVYELGDMSYWDNKSYFETQYRIIQSDLVAQMVVDRLHLERELNFLGLAEIEDEEELAKKLEAANPAAILKKRLTVDPVQDSRLVRLRFSGQDPHLITNIVNTIAEAYIEQNLNRKLLSTKRAISWLSEQTQDLKKKLEQSETALYEFKKSNDILSTSMDDRVDYTGTRLTELSRELAKSQSDLLRAQAQYEAFKSSLPDNNLEDMAALSVMKNPLLKDLKIRYTDLLNTYTELSERYKEGHPDVVAVKSKLDQTQETLRREIRNIVEGAKADYEAALKTVQSLQREVNKIKDQARELTLKEVDYNRLLRDKQSNQAVFEQVVSRLKEVDLSGMLKVNNIRMLDPAKVPKDPIRPRVRVNIMIGIVLGLILALGTAITLDLVDSTLKSADDIQKYLNVPLLGIVPQVKIEEDSPEAKITNAPEIFTHLRPSSSIAECCRTVRTNISFMLPGRELSRILVTSASPKEGKTTIVSNLGITIANSGKRVLVIDTDMRRPRIHKAFGMDNDFGVSNLIMGTMIPEEAIRHTQIENLHILTCGPIPPNPSEMIGSERFKELIDELAKSYDRILFDSPPVIAVTDSMILSNIVDGVVLVVKCGKTLREEAILARKQLLDVNANLLGVVINHLDLDDREYGNYYYYYYHRYGYYYGEGDSSKSRGERRRKKS